jgi:hypothetical protein
MLATQTLIDQALAQIRAGLPELEVDLFPAAPTSYRLVHPLGAVLPEKGSAEKGSEKGSVPFSRRPMTDPERSPCAGCPHFYARVVAGGATLPATVQVTPHQWVDVVVADAGAGLKRTWRIALQAEALSR